MIYRFFPALLVCALMMSYGSSCFAHEIFQDALKEMYTLKSFSCKTCHQDNDDRKLRTPFADRIYLQLKEKKLSEKFAIAVAADEAAKAKDPDSVGKDKGAVAEFDKMVVKDFKIAFKIVAEQKMTIDDIMKEGLLNGARLDTKKLKKSGKDGDDSEADSSDAEDDDDC